MGYIYLDVETVAIDQVGDFVPPPDLSAIAPARNLRDPVKIAEDIERKSREAQDEYTAKLSRAALDFNLNRIVCLGIAFGDSTVEAMPIENEEQEACELAAFWQTYTQTRRRIVGFCARTFDLPTLIQRSRLLGVVHPQVSLARYRGESGDVIDLREILTFDDMRYESIMPRTLHNFCKRFGIPVADETSGADIAKLVQEGNWQAVQAHCQSDVELTRQLAYRVLRNAKPEAEPVYQRTGEAIL